jgi:hypothetical protein
MLIQWLFCYIESYIGEKQKILKGRDWFGLILLLIIELNLSATKCLQAFGNLLVLGNWSFKLISNFVIESVEVEEIGRLLLIR